MNKKVLIKKIANQGWATRIAKGIIDAIDAEGWLRNPGEPIDPADIKVGDRVRRVHGNGDEVVGTAEYLGGWVVGCEYFLLDRPKPEPTEAEKLAEDLMKADRDGGHAYRDGYYGTAQYLIDHGWTKVPGGGDE